jgi:hypothetical protein
MWAGRRIRQRLWGRTRNGPAGDRLDLLWRQFPDAWFKLVFSSALHFYRAFLDSFGLGGVRPVREICDMDILNVHTLKEKNSRVKNGVRRRYSRFNISYL